MQWKIGIIYASDTEVEPFLTSDLHNYFVLGGSREYIKLQNKVSGLHI